MIKLEILNKTKQSVSDKTFLSVLENAEKTLKSQKNPKYLKHPKGTINLYLITDKEIQKINKDFRKKDKPTDVISISYIESPIPFPSEENIGEIFISIPTAKIQAKTNNHTLNKELQTLFVHGVLHIFGFTHETDKKLADIIGITEKILQL